MSSGARAVVWLAFIFFGLPVIGVTAIGVTTLIVGAR